MGEAMPDREDRTHVLESGLLLGDRWVTDSAGGSMEHVNPATGKPHKTFAIASVDEVDEAVAAAREAFKTWRRWKPDARREVLRRLSGLLADYTSEIGAIAALESGNLYSEFVGSYVAEWFRYYAGWADKISGESVEPYPFDGVDFTVPEPIGIVGLIVTWNGPLGFCAMGGAPALAAGCCLVIKSPELAPFSPVTFGRLCLEAGIPPGVVNVVTGGPDVGHALVSHPGIDKISFTGGTATARKLQETCAATLKPMVMELGGKSANLVFADADLDTAVMLSSRFTNNAGQGCSMPTRLLIERPVYEHVLDGVVERATAVVAGDPFDPNVTMGPVISAGAVERILGVVDRAQQASAGRLVLGGHRIGGDLADGFFIEPTVFADVDNRSDIAQNEIFGPVLCVMPFDDEEEAVALANGTTFGLAAYAHTNDMRRARRLIRDLDAGNVHINGTGPGPLSPASPFGGVKQSGYGRQGSRLGLYEFLDIKNVYLNI
jgi:aldehyde dehydrogenase (NAD+)